MARADHTTRVNDWYNEEAAKVKNEARPLWKVEHTFGYQEWPKAAMMPQEGEGYMAVSRILSHFKFPYTC